MLYVASSYTLAGLIAVADTVKDSAKRAVREPKEPGLRCLCSQETTGLQQRSWEESQE